MELDLSNTKLASTQQALVQALLERAHLVAERAHRQVQLRGGAGQIARARDGDESLQGMQRFTAHRGLAEGRCELNGIQLWVAKVSLFSRLEQAYLVRPSIRGGFLP